MATSGLEKVKGSLECPLCIETFKDPVTLNCGHSFCRSCLNDYIKAYPSAVARKILPCSVCRREMKVPDVDQPMTEWGKQLLPSYTIKKLVEDVIQPAADTDNVDENCFACKSIGETTLAVMWCLECEIYLCQRCSQQHKVISACKDHRLDKLDTKTKWKKSLRIKCLKHQEVLKFYCKNCKKPICATCGILHHKKCNDIVAVDSMKTSILQSVKEVAAMLNEKRDNVTKLKSILEFVTSRQPTTVAEIRKMEKETIVLIQEKFQRDVDEVNRLAEGEKSRLKSKIKAAEIDVEASEQHSALLREALYSEYSHEICNAHELCQSGSLFPQTDPDGRPEEYLVELDYTQDLKRIQQIVAEVGKIKLTFEDMSQMKCPWLSRPLLLSQITAQTEIDAWRPRLQDITVVTSRDTVAVIVTDTNNCSLKCFYRSTSTSTPSRTKHITYKIGEFVHGITELKDSRIMVSVPQKFQLVTYLHATHYLLKEKTTSTKQRYCSLVMMENGHLVAGTGLFGTGRIDILDVSMKTAQVIRTLPSVFAKPYHLTHIQDRNIVASDYREGKVTCMTPEGDIIWTYSPPEGTTFNPCGITTNRGGDVIVVDGASHNVIVLTRLGEHKTDLLTPADTEITDPRGVHYDDQGYLYVTDNDRVLVYKM